MADQTSLACNRTARALTASLFPAGRRLPAADAEIIPFAAPEVATPSVFSRPTSTHSAHFIDHGIAVSSLIKPERKGPKLRLG